MLALSACVRVDTTNEPTPNPADDPPYTFDETMPEGTFGATGEGVFAGELTVRGYAETETVDEPFCTENCQRFEYVMFHVLATGNSGLADFLGLNEGNAYAGGAMVGLGCEEDDVIRYANHSDDRQMQEFTIDAATSEAVLESTEEEPVTLTLTKLPLTGGTEAPACYSHFTTIEL